MLHPGGENKFRQFFFLVWIVTRKSAIHLQDERRGGAKRNECVCVCLGEIEVGCDLERGGREVCWKEAGRRRKRQERTGGDS